MRFVKMHGLGNDYVYLDAFTTPDLAARRDLPRLARAVSDRHRGVGGDGLILICRPTPAGAREGAHVRMRMFNADGSEAQMCGNGVRCVAKFAHDRLGIGHRTLMVQTAGGVRPIRPIARDGVCVGASVDMGTPELRLRTIGVRESRLASSDGRGQFGVEAGGLCPVASFVGMGNPHMVVFTRIDNPGSDLTPRELSRLDLRTLGPMFERHPAFPDRINVHFAAVINRRRAVMRTWERGSGITQACGTGACAVLVAGVRTGRLSQRAEVVLPGGTLEIAWSSSTGRVAMTGPAEDAFEGEFPWPPPRAGRSASRRTGAKDRS